MINKRVFGFFLLIVGLVMILGTSPRITGNVVLDDVQGLKVIRILGIVFFIGGVILMASGRGAVAKEGGLEERTGMEVSEERHLAHNSANFEKLKSRYRFMDSHGAYPEEEKAFVVRYHAFPRGRADFSHGISEKKSPNGFYMAETRQDAIDTVERMRGLPPRDIDVVKIKISKNVYHNPPINRKGIRGSIVKRGGAIYNDESAEYIPPERYEKANNLIRKGLIIIEEE